MKTVRIHVNTSDQTRPVVFNYRQLYKRELKKQEPVEELPLVESTDDDFYKNLLKRAEKYAIDDDDNDEGSEEEQAESKKQVGDNYDFEDPFIDDSEMLLDEPQEYTVPEFDGFFVYHGPLDGAEAQESEKKLAPNKRKAPARAKPSVSFTANSHGNATNAAATTSKKPNNANNSNGNSTNEKNRKKPTAAQDDTIEVTPRKPPTSCASNKPNTSSTATHSTIAKKPTATHTTVARPEPSTSAGLASTKKVASTTDQPPKKKKKVDTKTEPIPSATPATTTPPAEVPTETATKKPQENAAEKKKKVPVDLKPLDPEIEVLMEKLRYDVQFESFENKAKFPLVLKPTVLEAGLVALRKNRVIDENLVQHLMKILPYNRFTLKKFLTTKSGQMRVDELQQEIDELAILLKQTIDKMMPEQQRAFNEKLAQSQPSTDEDAPTPKFRCNDEVRKILYDIIQTEEQSIHIANQVALHKDPEKKQEALASDGKARKLMYQRLLSCWPEGWMNSYEMSRQYSQFKSKIQGSDKKAAQAAQVATTSTVASSPVANQPSAMDSKKRKRPASSTSEDTQRKLKSKGFPPPLLRYLINVADILFSV
ncbi:hypothetical protein BD560DRAFT_405361 [Blakeslea trispora]|nr:hypothetical protein BD560DRAFT_405361 [Blakeslea trispora]